jgi:hypothetical protein
MIFFEAERVYHFGNTVDAEEVGAAWLLPQESLFRMRNSAEQADQITNVGDTEPNSDDADYWVANFSDTSRTRMAFIWPQSDGSNS